MAKTKARCRWDGKWKKAASITPGGRAHFWVKDTGASGVRWAVWDRGDRAWRVHGEQVAPSGRAPVLGPPFKSDNAAKRYVDVQWPSTCR